MPDEHTPEPPTAVIAASHPRHSSAFGWIVAFLFFPYGPFVYLARTRRLAWANATFFIVASALVHVGMVSVLSKTNHEVWQPWLVLLLGTGMYCLGGIQFMIGERRQAWSSGGRRLWRAAGWAFGVLLLVALLLQVTFFHMTQAAERPSGGESAVSIPQRAR